MPRSALARKPSYDRGLAPPPRMTRRGTGKRASRRKASRVLRWFALALVPLILLLGYVGLTAELAAQTYRLNADQLQQAQLIQTDDDLHQRVAQLQSVSKLEAAAAALHMKEPAHVAVLTLPPASSKPATTAFAARFASFTRLFFAP